MATNTPEVRQRWYRKDHVAQKQRVQDRRDRMVEWFNDLKATLSCDRCGFAHPAALDFHHRDPKTRHNGRRTLVNTGWGKERILTEIAKCEVLCANCHRIEHYESGY